jgi:type 1 glutamine amidotransferase
MRSRKSTALVAAGGFAAAALCAGLLGGAMAQQLANQPVRSTGGGAGVAPGLFTLLDANKDGAVTRDELKGAFERWFTEWDTDKSGSLTQEQIQAGLGGALPPPPQAQCGGQSANPQTPCPEHVKAMVAALPAKAPVQPKAQRRVLVLGRAAGFVHTSIPLAAQTVEELGRKTGAWQTTITYDAADINDANLKQYDAIVLASTTGHFLDDPNDEAATAARRKAFLDFVRGGKGLAGIHAATDSYHTSSAQMTGAPGGAPGGGRAAQAGRGGPAAAGRGGRGGGGRGGGMAAPVATQIIAQADRSGDKQVNREEFVALADMWFDKLDTTKAGRVSQADFPQRFAAVVPPPQPQQLGRTGFPIQQPATQLGPDTRTGTWPEFNNMIGGFFKFHWNDGQEIVYKIDEADHPLNAPFRSLKEPLLIADETYTFGRETYSRKNLRVLTSVDYDRMSAEDKAKEQFPRDDGDYALSWIKRDGKGRVFYMAHGHNESVYAVTPLLEHLLYGMQYALGDLEADDRPSVR